ncbi:LOW QUALITY PROTEIN: transmembrane protein 276 [Pterocles gutturalis]
MGGTGGGGGPGLSRGLSGGLSGALLCAVCLLGARRARQVTGGPAAGFLLQALAAASDTLTPLWPSGDPNGDPDGDPLPGAWVSAMLGQPLVAFAFHRLSGDRATANLLLGTAAVLAPAAARLPEEGRLLAARAVTFLTAASVLTLFLLTANGAGVLALLLGAGNLLPAPGTRHHGHPWVLAAGNLALQRALRVQQELGGEGAAAAAPDGDWDQ